MKERLKKWDEMKSHKHDGMKKRMTRKDRKAGDMGGK
jgi:hypothetical protein